MKHNSYLQQIREIALSFPETTEEPHFEKTSFRVRKKIFATLKDSLLTIKLSVIDQDVFSLIDKSIIYPVPNKWGKKGWTHVHVDKVDEEVLKDALEDGFIVR